MLTIIVIVALIIVILIIAYYVARIKGMKKEQVEPANEAREENKEENKEKIMRFLQEKDEIRNNDVEQLLGVQDAMATRYLDELEKEGKIKQVGEEGRGVYYKLV